MLALSRKIIAVFVVSTALNVANASLSDAHPSPVVVLSGNGLATLHLGARQSSAINTLVRLFGRASTRVTPTPALRNCGIQAQGSWHSLGVFFRHDRLVGLAFGPGRTPLVRTDAGLRLGDTLAKARKLYGGKLTTSGNNGGSWFIATSVGRIDGFLDPSGANSSHPSSKIITMDVGVVGCPAMSP